MKAKQNMKIETMNLKNDLSPNAIALWLGMIVFLALSVRLYVSYFSGLANYNTDTYSYFSMADAIMRGEPISYFPNGYPLIVALMKIVFGEDSLVNALLILNVVLSTLTVLLSYFIARAFLNPFLSLIACSIIAFWPNQINYVRQLLTEVPATFFLTLGILLVLKLRGVLAGLVIYSAGMIRSTLSPLGILIAGYFFWLGQKKRAVLLIAGVMTGALLNYLLIRMGIILESSNTGGNLLLSVNKSSGDSSFFSIDNFTEEQRAHPLLTYLKFAIENPRDFISLRLKSLWELWGPWPSPGDTDATRSFIRRLLIGIRFPFLLLALAALWFYRNSSAVVVIGMPILLVTMIHVAFFSSPRFTYVVEPFLIILAVAGSHGIYMQFSHQSTH